MSLEAQPQNQPHVEDTTKNDAAITEGGISKEDVSHSGKLPEGKGKEVPHTEYSEPLEDVAHRLKPVTSPADLDREPELLPEQKWFQKKPARYGAVALVGSLVATAAFMMGRSGNNEKEDTATGTRPTASAPAVSGVTSSVEQPLPSSTTEVTNDPVTPEDVKQQAELLKLPTTLYDPEVIASVVTPESDPELTQIRVNYPDYQDTYGAQARAFLDVATVETVQKVQKAYYDAMEHGTVYDPVSLAHGQAKEIPFTDYMKLMSKNNGINQFPLSFPTTSEIQRFTPSADAKDPGTFLGLAARQDSLNDQLTVWFAQNELDLKSFNDKQPANEKVLPTTFGLTSFISLGFADDNSSFANEVIPQRRQGYLANPYDAAAIKYSPEGGFVVNQLRNEDTLGPNKVDIQGYTAVYNRIQNGKKVPTMGTYMLVPLKESIVDGQLVKKPVVVPAMVWQTELNPLS